MNTQLIKRAGFLFLTAILVLSLTAWKPPPGRQAPTPEQPAGIALAVTITVTNLNDSGAGSLRQAIADAAPDDTITFDSSLSGGTIHLASTLTLSKNVTIDGSALAVPITISGDTDDDGAGDVQVFYVNSGVTATLNSLTITKGYIFGDGGGIYNNQGTLTVTNSTFSGNSAYYHGGGIYNYGTLTVTNSTFSGNSANYDGGIANNGTLTVTNSTFSGNSANSAFGHGGGIDNFGTLTVTNSTFSGNSAYYGGGIFNQSGTTTVDSSTVSANTATNGGGIYNDATLNIQNDSLIGEAGAANTATNYGGGIFNGGTLTLDASTVSANLATSDGGGIWNCGTLTLDASTISANTASRGSGIWNSGTLTLDASTVSANTADYGGGIFNNATLTIQNGSLIGGAGAANTATIDGGGINNDTGGSMTLDASTVSANTAGYGGGIWNSGTLSIQNTSTVSANTATINTGGGIYNDTSGSTTLDASTVSANSAASGAGIYNNATLTIQNGSLVGGAGAANTAGADGGGIYNDVGGSMTLDASTVSANTAYYGGGIWNSGTLSIQNASTVSANLSNYVGGGIINLGTLTIQNASTVSANSAYIGGGIFNQSGTTTVDASTVSANSADYNGGGIWNSGTLSIQNASKLLANTATNDGDAVFNEKNSTNAVSVTGSCIVNNGNAAFFNNQSASQTATGNWWGNATGPGPVGTGVGDTVSANVDTSGYLTAPILGCPSVTRSALAASKAFAKPTIPLNTTTKLTITLTNPNTIPINWISFTDALPSGLTASAATALQCGGVVNISTPLQIVFSGGSLAANDGSPGGPDTCAINVTVRGIVPGIQTNASFAVKRTGLPDGYSNATSITVYKTLQFRSSGTVDGWVLESGEFSNKGGSFNATFTTFYIGDDALNKQYRSILSFNTSGLPDDAVILSAMLKIKKQGLVGSNPFNNHQGLLVDIKKPYFGNALALAAHDFQAIVSKSAVGTFGTTASSGWYSATLLNKAYPYINRTGTTQLRLRFTLDDDNDNTADYMKFFSGNYGTATDRPVLVIQYYIP